MNILAQVSAIFPSTNEVRKHSSNYDKTYMFYGSICSSNRVDSNYSLINVAKLRGGYRTLHYNAPHVVGGLVLFGFVFLVVVFCYIDIGQ